MKEKGRAFTLFLLFLGLAACRAFQSGPTPSPAPTVSPQQHLIFHNGAILTMDTTRPEAQAMAIAGDRIEAVGGDAEILALRRPGSVVVDLQGRTLMPGFVDPHTHLLNDAEQYLEMSLAEAQQVALENGITTIGDLYVTEEFLQEMAELAKNGQLRLRTSLYLVATDNCGRLQGEWYKEYAPTHTPGEMLRIGGVKIFTDGGTCERPALSYELQAGEGLGDLFFSQEELNSLVAEAQTAGFQVAIHAIGDRAVEQAQTAIAAALAGQPNSYRHRIEHNAVIRPELLPRYGEIGIVPVIFGPYPVCNPFGPPPPPEYQSWEWPWRALLDANPGLPVAWHGDDPFFGRIRPLDDLYSLVTRNEVGEDGQVCESPTWQKVHTITAAEALPLMTRNAAYALFRDEEVGRLAPGQYADLIILSGNPLAVEPEAIKDLEVWLAMVGGRVEYCAAGREAFCPSWR
ncbi:MAG: amidohydrolase family protein [Chloroflexi bacterium]|nr:amidohydrolase family protein [Chloroflexota bacterium]MCI0579880.1 amidohydrolase family protein [Chloroflexota bacterium]MCI0646161.1 amidohydrolase family protein [Chloroflexota bacterium]MCI0729871.1 amidohydrolase family protein [Chloroflexota bacterium]